METADCKLSSFHASSFSEHLQKHSKHSNLPNESYSETHGAKKKSTPVAVVGQDSGEQPLGSAESQTFGLSLLFTVIAPS